MTISAIVARSKNNIIGIDNKLPWYLPGDMKFFSQKTMGHHLIMGRISYECLPGPLKGRTIITVTRNKDYFDSSCVIKHSIEEALLFAKKEKEKEVFILGGGEIYNLTKKLWDKLYITDVDVSLLGDTTFVDIDLRDWKMEYEEHQLANKRNEYNYTFRIYRKTI